eukprot:6032123-Amphidinium_carterae.1
MSPSCWGNAPHNFTMSCNTPKLRHFTVVDANQRIHTESFVLAVGGTRARSDGMCCSVVFWVSIQNCVPQTGACVSLLRDQNTADTDRTWKMCRWPMIHVQFHTVQIVNAKKGGGHKAYRLKRHQCNAPQSPEKQSGPPPSLRAKAFGTKEQL